MILGGFEIHAIDADAGAADDLGALELGDDLARQRHRAVHNDAVGVFAHFHDLGVVGRAAYRHIGVHFGEDRLDQIHRNIVAAKTAPSRNPIPDKQP